MIKEEIIERLNEFISAHQMHHKFKIEAVGAHDTLYFELVFTSVMAVDRLFIKAISCGDCIDFVATSAEDNTEAIDWIERHCDNEIRGEYIIKF
jgi:hypothetical protein